MSSFMVNFFFSLSSLIDSSSWSPRPHLTSRLFVLRVVVVVVVTGSLILALAEVRVAIVLPVADPPAFLAKPHLPPLECCTLRTVPVSFFLEY